MSHSLVFPLRELSGLSGVAPEPSTLDGETALECCSSFLVQQLYVAGMNRFSTKDRLSPCNRISLLVCLSVRAYA